MIVFTCNVIFCVHMISPTPETKIGHINSFFELEAEDIDKKVVKFDQFKGKVTVITNVASYCGEYLFCCLIGEIYIQRTICANNNISSFKMLYGGIEMQSISTI